MYNYYITMPELPEVETIRRGLTRTIVGKKISGLEVRKPKIISFGPKTVSNVRKSSKTVVKVFCRALVGQKFLKVSRRAKLLILDLSGPYTILIHLKMTGQLIYARKGERKEIKVLNAPNARRAVLPFEHTHLIFQFSDGSRLFYNDLRQFGYIRLVHDKDLPKVKELAEFGPEPDSARFSADYLLEKARRRPGLSIKQFLTDPTVVAGIGNIYSDEILFWARLRPTRRLRSLVKKDFESLVKSARKVLKEALRAQGSSVGDYFKVDGSEGRYGKQHKVYGRAGERCFNCGEIIQSVKLGGRTASFCPVDQK
jgi:formamidopyrimidine-DNA glycosylase